ncbi:MAG: redoxin domain-containing protein [Deltaproteobacteria bacterium]|nr:redoxin domain-containing protein [Deltaproteobacteria bacterium]
MQLRHYVELQEELAVNYCKLAVCSVDAPIVNDAFRTGLGAKYPFLSDQDRKVVTLLDMTETSKTQGVTAMPHTFSLLPDLTIHNLYNGYWYLGRPTLDELRADMRAMLRMVRPDFLGPEG